MACATGHEVVSVQGRLTIMLGARSFDGRNRAIGLAFLISLALHAALLAVLSVLRPTHLHRANTTAAMYARLVELPSKPVPNQVFLPPAVEPKPPAIAQSARKPQPLTKPEPDVPLASQVVLKSSSTPATAQPVEAPDAGTLAQYRLSVLGAARRFKHYPDVAVQNNWQGEVEVRMVIDSSGEISGLDVRTSAGHPVLDQHALEMIERAKAIAPIPPALRGREFSVDVPVVFSLLGSGA